MEAIKKIEENVPVIQTLLQHFEAGSAELLGCVTEDIDLRIEHYRDDTDVSWQRAESIQGLVALLGRLTAEIFPQGTKILGLDSTGIRADVLVSVTGTESGRPKPIH